ncbi:MAG: murein L,D-transpeptidase, partial [Hymenobacter sp.]
AATSLKPGQASPEVGLLRQRLLGNETAGPAAPPTAPGQALPVVNNQPAPTSAEVYGPELVEAVKGFQRDAGLPPTGIVSGETLRQLNVPLTARINQVILNMERWRWLPKKFEPDYLLVNIPEYRLRVYEEGKEALTMRVIVGKTLNATPVFSDKMEYVVLSPYWNVPFSIIDKELRPKLAANPQAVLNRLDMEVVKGYGRKATVINPTTVDWANVTPATFKYTLRRRPGPKNDLGEVKFIFPNSNDIYLHDTPHDELFSQTARNFSHGCVRVEKPVELATYLLRKFPQWDRATIEDTISQRHEKYITLKEKLPVYLVYLTAWADANGHVHFRNDIYGHDKSLAKEYFG